MEAVAQKQHKRGNKDLFPGPPIHALTVRFLTLFQVPWCASLAQSQMSHCSWNLFSHEPPACAGRAELGRVQGGGRPAAFVSLTDGRCSVTSQPLDAEDCWVLPKVALCEPPPHIWGLLFFIRFPCILLTPKLSSCMELVMCGKWP